MYGLGHINWGKNDIVLDLFIMNMHVYTFVYIINTSAHIRFGVIMLITTCIEKGLPKKLAVN